MNKLLFFASAFIFSFSTFAQAPALTFTNVTGSMSITCSTPIINVLASVSNYTTAPLTFTWVSPSASLSGTNVNVTSSGAYTVIAFNIANSFSISQVYSIGINTIVPSSTVTPTSQNIICPSGSPATFTSIATNTLTNVTQSWDGPYSSGSAISNGTVSVFSLSAPGVFTTCVTDNINGCSTCKTVTVTSASSFPTFFTTSTTQFNLGCGSNSVSTINITNVQTMPFPSPTTHTILPPTFIGPTYNPGPATSFPANFPGTYTVIVKDLSNNCETHIPISVSQNTTGPNIAISAPTQTLSCYTPSIVLTGLSTNTNISYSWVSPSFTSAITSSAVPISTIGPSTSTIVSNYTLTLTNQGGNLCSSTQSITIYQNIMPPTPSILPLTAILTCSTPSVIISNGAASNIPPVFNPTLPILTLAWHGPVPQASVTNSSTYQAYTPGTYTMVVQDLNNGCTATGTKNVAVNMVYPQVTAPAFIPCPTPNATLFPIVTGSTSGLTYSWVPVPTATMSSLTQATITVNMPGNYTVIVTDPANGCATTSVLTVPICTGTDQNLLAGHLLNIYPNPSNGLFTVDLAEKLQNTVIEIYSVSGILVKKQAVMAGKTDLNLENEATGIYFIYLKENEKAIKTAKIVKQ